MKKIMMIVLAAITAAAMFAGCASDNGSAGGSVSTDGSTSMEKVIGALGESFMAHNVHLQSNRLRLRHKGRA